MTATNLPRSTSKLIPSSTRMADRCPGDGKSCPIPSKASTQSLMPAIPCPNMSIHNGSRPSGQAGIGKEILAVCPRRHHTVRCQRPLSVLALPLMQGVQLCLVQSLPDVGDQIGRVFDADREPDRGGENADFFADVRGYSRVWNAWRDARNEIRSAACLSPLDA